MSQPTVNEVFCLAPSTACGSEPIADIYKSFYRGELVALKIFRTNETTRQDSFKQDLSRKLQAWRGLKAHPSILPLCNTEDDSPYFAIMTPWQENGNISLHLRLYPNVERLRLVVQLSDALTFLHSQGFLHGSVHPGNILISSSGAILLSEFDLVDLRNQLTQSSALDLDHIRYMPPEHLVLECAPNAASDTFSFASVSFEILSHTKPFADHLSSTDVVLALHAHEPPFTRPSRRTITQSHLDEALWRLMYQCWNPNPDARPQMSYARDTLQKIGAEIIRAPTQSRL